MSNLAWGFIFICDGLYFWKQTVGDIGCAKQIYCRRGGFSWITEGGGVTFERDGSWLSFDSYPVDEGTDEVER